VRVTPATAFAFGLLLSGVGVAGDLVDRRVDVGGFRLRARVMGSGHPAVVFDSGGGGATVEDWGPLPGLVAEAARVVVYDRAGIGGSDAGAAPRSAERIARELHALLEGLGVRPPYVLVGHSLGGLHIRFFAQLYPGDVAGLVFLDPTTEEMRPRLETEADRRRFEMQLEPLPAGAGAEMRALAENVEALARLGPPPDVPAVILSGMAPPHIPQEQRAAMAAAGVTDESLRAMQERTWRFHVRLAARFPRGRHVAARESGHDVHLDQPGLVRDEILRLVDVLRSGR
jgi:pimeloyl-ACP methyl ester carboxylesterase